MKPFKILPVIVTSFILLFIAIPINYGQGRKLSIKMEELIKNIKIYEKHKHNLDEIKRKIDSGRYYYIRDRKGIPQLVLKDDLVKKSENPWEVFPKINAAKEDTKQAYSKLLSSLRLINEYLLVLKNDLNELEKEQSKRYQEGHGYIEVKINKEQFLRPNDNLVRWNWQFRFDEINGVGVTLTKCWVRGYRGSEEKINKREPLNRRIEPYGSTFIDTPYMQYGTKYDKTSSGSMKYVYTGTDDNGNEVKAELEITRYP